MSLFGIPIIESDWLEPGQWFIVDKGTPLEVLLTASPKARERVFVNATLLKVRPQRDAAAHRRWNASHPRTRRSR
jgi:hypothetical protein